MLISRGKIDVLKGESYLADEIRFVI
jgi:hypothetical protein